ncbi:MAG: SusD/RagB family nutrient-binding outer membrane lipoprotein [Prevotellaceae bacterium]|nr:SusD/RagB family nutrient-binding outer membrane lipoprotein [Prevotellaceae bacterium]
MKKIISLITILLTCVFTFSRCSDDEYTDKYNDPNKVTKLLIDKLMVGVFTKSNTWAIQGYDRYYSQDNLYFSNFTQSFGRPYSNTMYHPGWSDDGSDEYTSFFGAAAQYKKLEQMYNELSDAEKPSFEAYMLAAKTHVYAYMLSVIDLYGSIPWKDAGMVVLTGDISYNGAAHFDNVEDLYKMIIDEMKTAGTRFASVSKPKDFTATQDFINGAEMKMWQKYANSVCMRAALRVASQGSLTAVGRAALKEMIENPAKYPVVETNDDNIDIHNLRTDPVNSTGGYGLGDADGSSNQASDALVSRMLSNYDRTTWSGTYQDGIDDPRVPLLWDLAVREQGLQVGYPSYADTTKTGADTTIIQSGYAEPTVFRGSTYEMDPDIHSRYTSGAKGISLVRHNGLFWENENWDHQIISAAEMWFIKAEAIHQGWANGDAKAAFKEGVKQSIKFFFKYHKERSKEDADKGKDGKGRRGWVINPKEPTDAWIDSFAEARWNEPINTVHQYRDRLDAIITQKYVNFNIMYVREAWNDLRRTGYPSGLQFPHVNDPIVPDVPVRLRYPTAERDFNKNFADVAAQDNYTTKMFWAK